MTLESINAITHLENTNFQPITKILERVALHFAQDKMTHVSASAYFAKCRENKLGLILEVERTICRLLPLLSCNFLACQVI